MIFLVWSTRYPSFLSLEGSRRLLMLLTRFTLMYLDAPLLMILLIAGDSGRVNFHSSQPFVRPLLEHFFSLSSPRPSCPLHPPSPTLTSLSVSEWYQRIKTYNLTMCTFLQQCILMGRIKKRKKEMFCNTYTLKQVSVNYIIE